MGVGFVITDTIHERDRDMVMQGLLRYNLERLEDKNPKDLGVYLRDEAGEMLAGLIGHTHGNWVFVKYLWVGEALRKQGIGGGLLEQAEKAARERGCKYAFLDTFSFQAPAFYQKHGYREVFALDAYPVTGKRHYFTKTL